MKTIYIYILLLVLVLAASALFAPYDDTDNAETRERSGLVLRTDHGTGCQYLVAHGLFGISTSITPRLDQDGLPVCK